MRQIALAAAIAMASAGMAEAVTSYRTTISIIEGATGASGMKGSVVFDWSSAVASGDVFAADLSDLSLSFVVENASNGPWSWSETIVAAGVVQPIAGVARDFSGFRFEFDLDVLLLTVFDNDLPPAQSGGGTGESFNVLALFPAALIFDRFVDGSYDDGIAAFFDEDPLWTQTTERLSAVVPVPAAGWLLLSAFGAAAGLRRLR